MSSPIYYLSRAGLVALLAAVPGGAAFAAAMVDSSLTTSNLTIEPASGTVSFELPLGTSATTRAFNSLDEEVFDGNSGTGPVSTIAMVTFAQGTAMASTSSVSASASVNIPADGTVLAGVNVPGSDGDFSGLFDINGASTNPVNVTFSMQVSISLHGVSDIAGFLQNGDLTAELNIDGTPVLFDLESLPGLLSIAGVNITPTRPAPFLLIRPVRLFRDVSEDFDRTLRSGISSTCIRTPRRRRSTSPSPASLSLLLAGSGALAWQAH